MPQPGTSGNPVVVRNPGDLRRATRQMHRPTEQQARADNYRMGHVVVGGLRISIETPKDDIRRGVDPKGARWHTRMLADYGYIKGTSDHDTDQVDVYLGPDTHLATVLPVWVVDQVHAHNGVFDEHKCMVGFANALVARDTYIGGFSDGRGRQRVGAVVRMSFQVFKDWVLHGDTKTPLAYHHNPALGKNCDTGHTSEHCLCARCRAQHGGRMTENTAAGAGNEPKMLGKLTAILSSVFPRMTPEERQTLMADAAAMANESLGKATEHLVNRPELGIGQIEDLWDGPADTHATIVQSHGPGSTAAPGSVNVGPPQHASGAGAERMEPQYSRHAPQGGVQTATEALGREVSGMKGSMKAIIEANKGFAVQLEALKASVAASQPASQDAMQQMITDAVSKALTSLDLAKTIKKTVKSYVGERVVPVKIDDPAAALAKAEEEKKESEKEDEKDEHDKFEMHKEADEEGEDEAKKALPVTLKAAELRLQAKERVRKAKRAVELAQLYKDMPEVLKAYRKTAKNHLEKARELLATAMTETGRAGPSTLKIQKRIEEVNKARKNCINPSQAENQDKWPSSEPKQVGKAEPVEAATPPQITPDLINAVDKIQKAAEGMGMMTASVGELIRAVGGGGVSVGGGSGNLPPVFALAKSMGGVTGAETALSKLRDDKVISFDQFEAARDVLNNVRQNLPVEIINVKMARLPKEAQDVLNRAA